MTIWNERFGGTEYLYGTEPNDFLRAQAGQIPAGPVLCLAEGEGRNAVFVASLGHEVTAVDLSERGLEKTRALAESRGVQVQTTLADLEHYDIGPGRWTGIVAIFMHLPPSLRAVVLGRVVEGLRPGGVFLMEAYTPEQLSYGTGGPQSPEFLVTLDQLQQELVGLEVLHAEEVERDIHEGEGHNGLSSVVQVIARKPGASPA